jgi:TAG lipase/lysophosphatidylethanolamine acyltransferase
MYIEIKWEAFSPDETEGPETRLSELFNVNHFIVSQATPYIAPFLSSGPRSEKSRSGMWARLNVILALEFKHRIHQASILFVML